MTAQPADDWQQNAGVALIQLQTLERSEQPGTGEQYRSEAKDKVMNKKYRTLFDNIQANLCHYDQKDTVYFSFSHAQ